MEIAYAYVGAKESASFPSRGKAAADRDAESRGGDRSAILHIVYFADGRKYVATFFTRRNIESIMRKDQETGECARGLYSWAANMIVVERLDRQTIEKTVSDLLASGEFAKAFDEPHAMDGFIT